MNMIPNKCPLCEEETQLIQIGSSKDYFCTSCRSVVSDAAVRLLDNAIGEMCAKLKKMGASFWVCSPRGAVFREDIDRLGKSFKAAVSPGSAPRLPPQKGRRVGKASARSRNVMFWKNSGLTKQILAIQPDSVGRVPRPEGAGARAFMDAVTRRCFEYFGNNYTAVLTPDKKHAEIVVGPDAKPYVRGQRKGTDRSAIWAREDLHTLLSDMEPGILVALPRPPEVDIGAFQKYVTKVLTSLYGQGRYRTSALRDGSALNVWRI